MGAASRVAYRPALDGVRALAVVAVLAYHDGRLPGGFLGVSTFFTLSGFLITWLLLAERDASGRVRLRAFFARRARRLLPAAIAGVVLAALVAPVVAAGRGAPGFRGDAFAALANAANWRFVLADRSYADAFAAPSPVLHFWSLAVEEQFYVVLAPLIAVLLLGRGNGRLRLVTGLVLLTAASVAAGAHAVVARGDVDRAYFGTDARAAEFLVGALVAVAYTRRPLSVRLSRLAATTGVIAIVLLAAAAFRTRGVDASLFRGGLVVHAALVGAVLVAACEPGPVRRVLGARPLRALGRVSYGVYVYHWPLFLVLDGTVARLGATIAVAAASYLLLERPVREGRFVSRRPGLVAPAYAVTAIAVVVLATGRIPPSEIVYEPATSASSVAIRDGANDARDLAERARGVDPSPPRGHASAAAPPAPAGQRLLLVGDSVGLTLGRGIERWGESNGVAVLNGGVMGCTLLHDAHVRGYWGVDRRPFDPCRIREGWPAALARFEPDAVVVSIGAWDVYDASWDGGRTWHAPGDPEWNRRYAAEVEAAARMLTATGVPVLWIAPPCFAAPGEPDEGREWYDAARVRVQQTIARDVARRTGIAVSTTVARHHCPVDLDARPDGVHFSDAGADATTAALVPEMRALLAPPGAFAG